MARDIDKKITSTDILNKTFRPNVKGYDPDEVDAYLDEIRLSIDDAEKRFKDLSSYNSDLEKRVRALTDEKHNLEVENASMKKRLRGVKDTEGVNENNIDLINRIDVLEKALWAQGVDPMKLK